jgi:ribosome-associated translation inhibitor RaiA
MVVQLANIIIRQAEKTQNARAYIDELITAKFTTVNAQNGQIVGTTVNGKTLNLQAMPGTSLADIMSAAELALSTLERGLNRVPRQTSVLFR